MSERSGPINRWLITGTVTTLTELHVGDGSQGALHDRSKVADKSSKDQHDANTVMVDHKGQAMIPGSSFKGPIRALLRERGLLTKASVWTGLLGVPEADGDLGGKVRFRDAFWKQGCTDTKLPYPQNLADLNRDRARPWWDDRRRTCVQVGHARDPVTNTVEDLKLYHREIVPPGETFAFAFAADNLTEEEAKAWVGLMRALEDAKDHPPLAIGAVESKNWGLLQWVVDKVLSVGPDEIRTWLDSDSATAGDAICEKFGRDRKDEFTLLDLPKTDTLVIDLDLDLLSPWLVGDPKQGERCEVYKDKTKKKEWKPDTHGEKPPDAIGIVDSDDKPFDPATSLAGTLRGQAARIYRTLGGAVKDRGQPLDEKDPASDLKRRDPVAKLFGMTGWKAPIEVTRASVTENPGTSTQEFVAIDRYTGGSASDDGLKFNAKPTNPATMSARLVVRLDRLTRAGDAERSLALLALTLRDLIEGDIAIGAKASIGYGEVGPNSRVKITRAGVVVDLPTWLNAQDIQAGLAKLESMGELAARQEAIVPAKGG